MKQHSAGGHIAPHGHIILNSEPTTPIEEVKHYNCIVFGLTWQGLESPIYDIRIEHANNYTTDAIEFTNDKSVLFEFILQSFSLSSQNALTIYIFTSDKRPLTVYNI